jgi:hypothetical protein
MRLVFVADKPDAASGLQAFELPLAFIMDETFKQPIFAANNLSGKCFMVEGGPASGNAVHFTLYFKEGGVGTIIPFFFRSCAYVRSVASRLEQQHQQQQYQQYDAPSDGTGYPPAATGGDSSEPTAPPPQHLLQTALVDPSGGWCGWCVVVVLLFAFCLHCVNSSTVRIILCISTLACVLAAQRVPPHNCAACLPPAADPTKVYLTQPLDSSQQRPDEPKFPAPLV